MESGREKLYEGLGLMYRGGWILLIGLFGGMLLILVPKMIWLGILGLLAALLGAVIRIVGQVKLCSEHRSYKTALVLMIVGTFCNLAERYGSGGIAAASGFLEAGCSLAGRCFLIHATNRLLRQRGREDIAAKGRRALAVGMICALVTVVLGESAAPLKDDAEALTAILVVASVAAIVSEGFMLGYLKGSRDAFRG